jgi:hypothetical protein
VPLPELKRARAFPSPALQLHRGFVLQAAPGAEAGPGAATATVGILTFKDQNNVGKQCSASVVGPHTLLTAAHCVKDHASGLVFSRFRFYPGVDGIVNPLSARKVNWLYTFKSWVTDRTANFRGRDLAFINTTTGFNAWEPLLFNAPLNGWIYHLGYPVDVGGRHCSAVDCHPWYCLSPIQGNISYGANFYAIGITCNTQGGASGGPLWEWWNGQWYVAGPESFCPASAGRCTGNTAWGIRLNSNAKNLYSTATAG